MIEAKKTDASTPFPLWLQLLIITISTTILGLGGYWYYNREHREIRLEMAKMLEAVGELKAHQIEQWRKERLSDAKRAAESPYFQQAMESFRTDDPSAIKALKTRLNVEKTAYNYDDVLVLDLDGNTLCSALDESLGLFAETRVAMSVALAENNVVMTDIYQDSQQVDRLDVVTVMREPSGNPLCFFVIRTRTDQALFPILQSSAGGDEDMEFLLIKRQDDVVKVLNPRPRIGDETSASIFHIDNRDVVAVKTALGETGTFEGTDYRGQYVLAHGKPIADSPWFIVTKANMNSIHAAAQARAWQILALVTLMMMLTALVVALINRHIQAQRYRTMYEAEQRQKDIRIKQHETEELLRLALRNSLLVVFQQDTELRYTRIFNVNPELKDIDIIGKRDHDLLPAREAARLTALKQEAMNTRSSVQAQVQTSFNGKTFHYDLRIEPHFDESGKLTGITGASMDITNRIESEAILQKHLDYERLLTQVSLMAAETEDLGELQQKCIEEMGRLLDVSRTYIFEYHAATETVDNTFEWVANGVLPCKDFMQNISTSISPAWSAILKSGNVLRVENTEDVEAGEMKDLLQSQKVCSCLIVPLMVSGRIYGLLGFDECRHPRKWPDEDVRMLQTMARSITGAIERNRVEAELRDSNTIFDLFMENSPMYLFFKDENRRVLKLSRNFEELAGKPIADLIGKTNEEIFPVEFGKKVTEDDLRIMREGKRVEVEEAYNGRIYSTIKFPIFQNGKARYLAGFTNDITERKRIESELRLQSSALAAAANAIVITNRDGTIAWVNEAFTRVTGYRREEAIGKNPRELVKSGKQDESFYKAMWETILKGQTWRGEIINRRKDGKLYPEELSITPLKNEQGEITHFIAIKQDISEKRMLEDQFRQAQKLEAVGRLAGGVAHDFNNLLTVIMANSEMVLSRLDSSSPIFEEIEEIAIAGKRSADLTRQLLAFARKQTIHPKTIDLNESIESMLKMLRRLIGEQIELEWKPAASVWPLYMDPAQIDQVLANLIVNARDAIGEFGKITIGTANAHVGEESSRQITDCKPGDYVVLSVADNGCGMDKETLRKIFEPFFTTKEQGKGTGLGLATVYGIVKQNNGVIAVESEAGKGSVFSLYLPRHAVEPVDHPGKSVKNHVPRGTETILLVEDEPALLRVTSRMLQKLGYRILEALSPSEAIDKLKNQSDEVQLVLTDVVMPNMSGSQLIDELRAIRPGLPCLFMSGYPTSIMDEHGFLHEQVELIEKPFNPEQIAVRLRTLLKGNAG